MNCRSESTAVTRTLETSESEVWVEIRRRDGCNGRPRFLAEAHGHASRMRIKCAHHTLYTNKRGLTREIEVRQVNAK